MILCNIEKNVMSYFYHYLFHILLNFPLISYVDHFFLPSSSHSDEAKNLNKSIYFPCPSFLTMKVLLFIF